MTAALTWGDLDDPSFRRQSDLELVAEIEVVARLNSLERLEERRSPLGYQTPGAESG